MSKQGNRLKQKKVTASQRGEKNCPKKKGAKGPSYTGTISMQASQQGAPSGSYYLGEQISVSLTSEPANPLNMFCVIDCNMNNVGQESSLGDKTSINFAFSLTIPSACRQLVLKDENGKIYASSPQYSVITPGKAL